MHYRLSLFNDRMIYPYNEQNDYEKSLELFLSALEIVNSMNDYDLLNCNYDEEAIDKIRSGTPCDEEDFICNVDVEQYFEMVYSIN